MALVTITLILAAGLALTGKAKSAMAVGVVAGILLAGTSWGTTILTTLQQVSASFDSVIAG